MLVAIYRRSSQLVACRISLGLNNLKNHFEQLCINYSNEKLQQKYVMDNFHQGEEAFNMEGIKLFDLALMDNKDILEVMEGPTLNNESLCLKRNNSLIVSIMKTLHRDPPS